MAALLRGAGPGAAVNCRRDIRYSRTVAPCIATPTYYTQWLHSNDLKGHGRCQFLCAVAVDQHVDITNFIPGEIPAAAVAAADRLSFVPFIYPAFAAAQVAA